VSAATVAGLLLIAVPLSFNAAFAALAARFDYPDVLRQPTREVLAKFRAGGTSLQLLWWVFALTAVLLAPLVVLFAAALPEADPALLNVATTLGVLAAAVQFLGLMRWPFLVPFLARAEESEAVDLVFEAFNRYLGVAVGEHLGYLLTGAWTTLAGVALLGDHAAVGVVGILIGPALMLCSLEFVGRTNGWRVAEQLTPPAYVAWSLWLIATGIAFL
jgi:Domain of unknown function (DUF4386)